MPPRLDPVAALAALDDAAIAEAATAGLIAGDFKSGESKADIVVIRYLQHSIALARALPARELLKSNASAETLFHRLGEDDAEDVLEECMDELVVIIIGPLEGEGVPDEAMTEAAVLAADHVMASAVNHLYQGVLKVGRVRQN